MHCDFKTFFISDLHLGKNTQNVALLFNHFMQNVIRPGDALFILGDFFEYWLGEDLLDDVQHAALIALKDLHLQGSAVFFMRGNRDFLVRAETLEKFGITLLPDLFLLTTHGKKVLLLHGDSLCTHDLRYQRYKKFASQAWVKGLFLHLPHRCRAWIAEKIHNQNPHGAFMDNPDYNLADATPEAIQALIDDHHPDVLIYGHVHKMARHTHETTTRMVLGDWYKSGNYIELSDHSIEAQVFTLTESHPGLTSQQKSPVTDRIEVTT